MIRAERGYQRALYAALPVTVAALAIIVCLGIQRNGIPVAEAVMRVGFIDEAQYVAVSPAMSDTTMYLPFVNADPDWDWVTTVVVQNVGVAEATVVLHYYDSAGSEVDTIEQPIPPGGRRDFTPTPPFSGSLMIESNEILAVVVDEKPIDQGRTVDGGMSYRGVAAGLTGNELLLMPAHRNFYGWSSFLAVQNVAATPVSVTLSFVDTAGALSHSMDYTLPPNGVRWTETAEVEGLSDGFSGSILIQGDGPVAAVIHSTNESAGTMANNGFLTSPTGEPAPPEKMGRENEVVESVSAPPGSVENYAPLLVNESGLILKNLAESSATYVIQLYMPDGTVAATITGLVAADAESNIYLGNVGQLPPGFDGSAVVSSDQPLFVSASNRWPTQGPSSTTAYEGVGATEVYTTMLVPAVSFVPEETVTSISAQNSRSSAVTITVTYLDRQGDVAGSETAASVPAHSAVTFDQAGAGLAAGFEGSAVVQSTGPLAVVGFISHKRISLPDPATISGTIKLQGRSDYNGVAVTAWADGAPVNETVTGPNGAYSLTVPGGIYSVTVEMTRYLDGEKRDINMVSGETTVLTTVTLLGGDANDTDIINILDLSLMGSRFSISCGDPRWDDRADINDDCTVNILDLSVAGGNFLKTSPVPWP